jgi:hypothetical protein
VQRPFEQRGDKGLGRDRETACERQDQARSARCGRDRKSAGIPTFAPMPVRPDLLDAVLDPSATAPPVLAATARLASECQPADEAMPLAEVLDERLCRPPGEAADDVGRAVRDRGDVVEANE